MKRAHLIRAALESITYQIADVVVAMRQHEEFTLTALMVDGGPTNNDWLMQCRSARLPGDAQRRAGAVRHRRGVAGTQSAPSGIDRRSAGLLNRT